MKDDSKISVDEAIRYLGRMNPMVLLNDSFNNFHIVDSNGKILYEGTRSYIPEDILQKTIIATPDLEKMLKVVKMNEDSDRLSTIGIDFYKIVVNA